LVPGLRNPSTRAAGTIDPGGRFDYTTVGHVTADVMRDGSRQPGGSAFYSALQASRLGRRTLIITKGVPGEIEELTEPYRGEFELRIIPAEHTTTLHTEGLGAARTQRLLAWAGQIAEDQVIDTAILHLAPVARETPPHWRGTAEFVGLTPQGLLRHWSLQENEIFLAPADPALIPASLQAMVLAEHERDSCATLIADAIGMGATVAITAGEAATSILQAGVEPLAMTVPVVERLQDDIGAGDVFGAAFFIALAEGRPAGSAAGFANAAAAVRISGSGPAAIGGRAAIEERLRATA
jgi:1D-myo-inositol 3-kinase